METKVCAKCGQYKSIVEFNKRSRGSKDGLQSYCRSCMKGSSVFSVYRLPPDEFAQMCENQGGRCAICGEPNKQLFIDHSHKTGKVRALLCIQCNSGLGYFRDNSSYLRKAANYVINYEIEHQTIDVLQNVSERFTER